MLAMAAMLNVRYAMAVDKRTDISAFGVVVYELLTGQALFEGATISDTLTGVLKTDPDWSALPPQTPPAIRRVLRHCLERDRKRRMRDIGDRTNGDRRNAVPNGPRQPLRAEMPLVTCLYFAVNTVLVSDVLALLQGKYLRELCSTWYV
jgi:serine/threonine protein kinase